MTKFSSTTGPRCRGSMATRAIAVLAGVSIVAAFAACSTDPAPQFAIQGTGNLSGLVFLDRDQNGVFDPSAGDSALPNLHVTVLERGDTVALTGGDTHTDAEGRFSVNGLPAGTHSLQVDTTGVGSAIAFCVNPMPVSIYLQETQFVKVDARGGCVVPIDVASQQAQNAHITVRGTVTSTLNQISTGTAYIEDQTGGLQLFSPTGAPFQVGDVIEVSGTLTTFSNELELTSGTIKSVSPGTPLAPADAKAQEALAAGGDAKANLQGRLIRVKAAKLLDAFTTGAGRNAQIDDGTGTLTVRYDTHVVADTAILKSTFSAGKCYDWTGILKAFTGPAVELFPRTVAEVVEVPCQP